MAEAEIYIELENEQLAKQSRMLQRAIDYGRFDDGTSSDEIDNKMRKLQMINQQSQQGKPNNEKIEFWEEFHQPKEQSNIAALSQPGMKKGAVQDEKNMSVEE